MCFTSLSQKKNIKTPGEMPMSQQITPQATTQKSLDELILVVKRNQLLGKQTWHGIKEVDFDHYLQIIQQKKEFLPRGMMENDPSYKQIIPYLVFNFEDTYFLMQRASKASETRLRNKYSLGIGGHIRQEDMTTDSIFEWAKREFHEEVNYNGNLIIKPLGILNDDSDDVGKVHIGFVLLLQGDSSKISIKSELKSGTLVTLEECAKYNESLESWSQLVLEFIKN